MIHEEWNLTYTNSLPHMCVGATLFITVALNHIETIQSCLTMGCMECNNTIIASINKFEQIPWN